MQSYKTLTSFNLFTPNNNSLNGDCVLKPIATVANKKPQGYKIGSEETKNKDQVLNALQVWSFCDIFRLYLNLFKMPKDFQEFYDSSNEISDELVYKLLTQKRRHEDNDLLTYLVNREEDDFFQLSDWPLLA